MAFLAYSSTSSFDELEFIKSFHASTSFKVAFAKCLQHKNFYWHIQAVRLAG
jgi:hypothetical protein